MKTVTTWGTVAKRSNSAQGGKTQARDDEETRRDNDHAQQDCLHNWLGGPTVCNIEAAGDPLRLRTNGNGTLRVGFQNIWGADVNKGFGVDTELDAMNELQVDIQGMAEANKPWNSWNKAMYQTQLDLLYNRATVVYSSAPTDYDCTYQPGGTMCILSGNSAGILLKGEVTVWDGSVGTLWRGNEMKT